MFGILMYYGIIKSNIATTQNTLDYKGWWYDGITIIFLIISGMSVSIQNISSAIRKRI